MKNVLLLSVIGILAIVGCSKENELADPVIYEFSATPTSLPKRDTVEFKIDARGDNITFFNGKQLIQLTNADMPYTAKVGRIRFRVTPPADTIYANLTVVNVYSAEIIKEVSQEIELILLDQ